MLLLLHWANQNCLYIYKWINIIVWFFFVTPPADICPWVKITIYYYTLIYFVYITTQLKQWVAPCCWLELDDALANAPPPSGFHIVVCLEGHCMFIATFNIMSNQYFGTCGFFHIRNFYQKFWFVAALTCQWYHGSWGRTGRFLAMLTCVRDPNLISCFN